MQHKFLVVLEAGPTSSKVAEYLARACAGAQGAEGAEGNAGAEEFRVTLFMQLPSLPPWLEAGDSRDVVVPRRQYEAEARVQAATCMAGVREYLVQHGVSKEAIDEEIAEPSDRIVPDIRDAAHRHGCDTIVVARHHKSIMREFLEGDIEEKLLRRPIEFTVWLVA